MDTSLGFSGNSKRTSARGRECRSERRQEPDGGGPVAKYLAIINDITFHIDIVPNEWEAVGRFCTVEGWDLIFF